MGDQMQIKAKPEVRSSHQCDFVLDADDGEPAVRSHLHEGRGSYSTGVADLPGAREDAGTAVEGDKLVVAAFLRQPTERTFYLLFEVFYPRILRFFRVHGLNGGVAEDLCQQVFLKVFCSAAELREEDRFRSWIYAISRNELANYWRYRKVRIQETHLDEVKEGMEDNLLVKSEVLSKLQLAEWIEKLEAFDRDLLIFRYVDGLSYSELAMALQIPIGTVKWRISELRRKLAKIIGATDGAQRLDNGRRVLPRTRESICDAGTI
jgi:RNA polymerase sigma-70 factor (ECF subfamily)